MLFLDNPQLILICLIKLVCIRKVSVIWGVTGFLKLGSNVTVVLGRGHTNDDILFTIVLL